MSTPSRRGLLVTGLPRSGTSWAGKMLEASGEVVYVNEPLNPGHPPGQSPGVLGAAVNRQFQYISPGHDREWRAAFANTLALRYQLGAELRRNRSPYDLARAGKYLTVFTAGRLRGRRAMLDDPFAILSTQWLVEQMGCQAVVLVRDPVAVVGSWRALNWTIHFHELLEQPDLMREQLSGYADRMRALIGSPDWLARSCLLWEMTYGLVDRTLRHLPGVQVVQYEALVRSPLDGFQALYDSFGLTWSARARARVRQATVGSGRSESSHTWSLSGGLSRTAYRPMSPATALGSYRNRLTQAEIDRVRALTGLVARRFYAADADEVPSAALDNAAPPSNRTA